MPQNISARVSAIIEMGFRRLIAGAEADAKAAAPVRTGRLRNGIRAYLDSRLGGRLVSQAPYSSFLHLGTGLYGPARRAYVIRPRAGKALFWPGAARPSARVIHRGIRPRGFLRGALTGAAMGRAFEGISE